MGITLDELKILSGEKNFNLALLEKDYLLTQLLYLLKDIKGIYFKGGTALNKIFLGYARLSEDLDFTLITKLRREELHEIIYQISHFLTEKKGITLMEKSLHDTGHHSPHIFTWQPACRPSGIYLIQLRIGKKTKSQIAAFIR